MVPRSASILTVNAGSSSLKLRLLDGADQIVAERESTDPDDESGLRDDLAALLEASSGPTVAAHRLVHGGERFSGPTPVDPSLERELEDLAELAPLHNARAVRAMRVLADVRPGLPGIACFDTAFHATLPAAATTYAIPSDWSRRWRLRRYGFHGLSHAYASGRAAELLGEPIDGLRLVTAHLGSGASLAAVSGGRSVDTTMGFTPLEGLVMSTRAGSVDPGLLLWVQRHAGMGPDEMERALESESGLIGLVGTADMREVIEAADRGEEAAGLAIDVYVHRLIREIAAMAAAMEGLDALVFTGGVGENAPVIRKLAVAGCEFLGLALDPTANRAGRHDSIISGPRASGAVLLIRSREDIEMARQARTTLT